MAEEELPETIWSDLLQREVDPRFCQAINKMGHQCTSPPNEHHAIYCGNHRNFAEKYAREQAAQAVKISAMIACVAGIACGLTCAQCAEA
jgi:hypothetical protein